MDFVFFLSLVRLRCEDDGVGYLTGWIDADGDRGDIFLEHRC